MYTCIERFDLLSNALLVSGGPCLVRANSYVYTVRYNFIGVNLSPWKQIIVI